MRNSKRSFYKRLLKRYKYVLKENENLIADLEKLIEELEAGKRSGALVDEEEAYRMLGVMR